MRSSKQSTPPRSRLVLAGLVVLLGAALAWVFLSSPKNGPFASRREAPLPSNEFQRGRELSQAVCSGCHLYPDPSALDKVTWASEVLPEMARWLGFWKNTNEIENIQGRVRAANLMPTTPAMSVEEWRSIWTYYLATAPAVAEPQPARPQIERGLRHFETVLPSYRKVPLASTTLVRIDEAERCIYLGESRTNLLTRLSRDGREEGSLQMPSAPAHLEFLPDGMLVTLIGSYAPSDELEGQVVRMPATDNSGAPYTEVLGGLPRPTCTVRADLNGDGRGDLVVCGYGNQLGKLAVFEGAADGGFRENVLLEQPGFIRAEVRDLDRDGLPDIVAMTAQAREGIHIFWNKGRGAFERQTVIEKPPYWGFSHFELADFNGDGEPDLLAVNGDNGDFTGHIPAFKSYHGVRIYLNDGRRGFSEAYAFPMNGAFRALARDFDKDGDLDIAAISFYPDYRMSPQESFVYLENRGGMSFSPSSFPDCLLGRWLTMDAGDLDGDGDLDIVLGAMNSGPTHVPPKLMEMWKEKGPPFLILKNTLR